MEVAGDQLTLRQSGREDSIYRRVCAELPIREGALDLAAWAALR